MQSPVPAPDTQPWLRQSDENNRWYSRFLAYLALGPGRSVRATYNQEKGNETSRQATPAWRQAAQRFDWERRAAAYDAWQHRGTLADTNSIDPDYTQKVENYARFLDQLHTYLADELAEGRINERLVGQYSAAIAIYAKLQGKYNLKPSTQLSQESSAEEARPQVVFYIPEMAPLPTVPGTVISTVDASPDETTS